jgi:hypothetical protein
MLAGGQFDNLPAKVVSLPLRGERVGTLDAFEESVRAHDPRNAERPEVVGEVKQPVSKLQSADIFADVNRVFNPFSKSHATPSPKLLNTSEQLPIGTYLGTAVQPINRFTKVIFDKRLVCDATVPDADNENFIPPEAA